MHRLLAATAILLVALAPPAVASAGGWAVATLDAIPSSATAGEAAPVGFTVRQHGITPVDLDHVAIVVTQADGTATRFAARRDGAKGHYRADVRFPASGNVTWRAELDWFGPQELGTLTVADAPSSAGVGLWAQRVGLSGGALLAAFGCARELRRRRVRKPLVG